jgi:tetratricopeptide (TPR) repeat protein
LALGQGNLLQARVWLEESLAVQLPLGAPGYANTLGYLSEVALYEGRYAEARAYCAEHFALSQNAGLTWNLIGCHLLFGHIALQERQWEEAGVSFAKALRQSQSSGQTKYMIDALEGLAGLAALRNQPERAMRLLAWTAAWRQVRAYRRRQLQQVGVDRSLAMATSQLTAAACEALLSQGTVLTLEQAVALALESSPNWPTSHR